MNLRLFTIAILALPLSSMAGSRISLERGDFQSAKEVLREGKVLVRAKLSKSGKAKFRHLNQSSVGQSVHTEIAGVVADLTLRMPIHGGRLEVGPFSEEEAREIVSAINLE